METACWFIKSYFYTDHLPPEYIHKSSRYAYIPPLIVDVKFVVLGFTYIGTMFELKGMRQVWHLAAYEFGKKIKSLNNNVITANLHHDVNSCTYGLRIDVMTSHYVTNSD